ncbi:hypothetical protein ACFL1M_03960, partial [Patescibacteria group bacterium]
MKDKLNSLLRKDVLWAVLLAVGFLVFFVINQPIDIVSYGSSDDFVRLGYLGGNYKSVHFSVLLKIVNLFTVMGFGSSVVGRGYFIASIFGSLCLGFVYLLISKITSLNKYKGETYVLWLSKVASVILLGFSYEFVTQSLVLERYIFVAFLLAMYMYLFLTSLGQKIHSYVPIVLYLLLGLGISMHWIFIPLFIYSFFILYTKKSWSIKLLVINIFIVLGVLFLTLLSNTYFSFPNTSHSYSKSISLSESIHDYKSSYLSDGFSRELKLNPKGVRRFLPKIYLGFIKSFGYSGLVLFVLGSYIVLKRKKVSKYIKHLQVFLVTTILTFGTVMPMGQSSQIDRNIMLSGVLVYIVCTIFICVGLNELLNRIQKGLAVIHSKKTSMIVVTILGSLILITPLLKLNESTSFEKDSGHFSRELL